MPELVLQARGLAKSFASPAGPLPVLTDVSLEVFAGESVSIRGSSGSGKTTTGRAIVKLAPLTAGKITYQGQDIGALSNAAFLPWRKKIQSHRHPARCVLKSLFYSLHRQLILPLRVHHYSMCILTYSKGKG